PVQVRNPQVPATPNAAHDLAPAAAANAAMAPRAAPGARTSLTAACLPALLSLPRLADVGAGGPHHVGRWATTWVARQPPESATACSERPAHCLLWVVLGRRRPASSAGSAATRGQEFPIERPGAPWRLRPVCGRGWPWPADRPSYGWPAACCTDEIRSWSERNGQGPNLPHYTRAGGHSDRTRCPPVTWPPAAV